MSKARKAWRFCKSELEKAFGKDFVKKNFKQDLGPDFDSIDSEIKSLVSELKALEKRVDAVVTKKKKVLELMAGSRIKLHAYGKVVKNKSRKEKTKHGEQWDSIEFTLAKGYMREYNSMNQTLRSVSSKLGEVVWVK